MTYFIRSMWWNQIFCRKIDTKWSYNHFQDATRLFAVFDVAQEHGCLLWIFFSVYSCFSTSGSCALKWTVLQERLVNILAFKVIQESNAFIPLEADGWRTGILSTESRVYWTLSWADFILPWSALSFYHILLFLSLSSKFLVLFQLSNHYIILVLSYS